MQLCTDQQICIKKWNMFIFKYQIHSIIFKHWYSYHLSFQCNKSMVQCQPLLFFFCCKHMQANPDVPGRYQDRYPVPPPKNITRESCLNACSHARTYTIQRNIPSSVILFYSSCQYHHLSISPFPISVEFAIRKLLSQIKMQHGHRHVTVKIPAQYADVELICDTTP